MSPTSRRSVLASIGTVALGGGAGCAAVGSAEPPAGSLRFTNDHVVPHSITMRVTGVGSSPGERPGEVEGEPTVRPAQRRLTASTVVDPGASRTYEGAFSEPVWYAVRFTVDGEAPDGDGGDVTFHPAPSGDEPGTILEGRVHASGEFSWVVTSTGNPGRFAR